MTNKTVACSMLIMYYHWLLRSDREGLAFLQQSLCREEFLCYKADWKTNPRQTQGTDPTNPTDKMDRLLNEAVFARDFPVLEYILKAYIKLCQGLLQSKLASLPRD